MARDPAETWLEIPAGPETSRAFGTAPDQRSEIERQGSVVVLPDNRMLPLSHAASEDWFHR